LIGGVLLARFGWRTFFVVLGAASLLWLVPWLRSMPRTGAAAEAPEWRPTTMQILTAPSAWGSFLGLFCGNYFWFFLLTWLPTYLVKERGFPLVTMTRISGAAFLTIATSTMIAGWVSDRWIRSGATVTRVRKTIVVCGLLGSTIILPVAGMRDSTAAIAFLLAACVSFGAFTSNHWAITQTLAGPLAAGRWTSLQNGVGNLAGVAASWFTGILVERTHAFAPAFVAAAVVVVAGALFWGLAVGRIEEVAWKK
jgi:predicted MFS family arabinose efflux permease